MRRLLELLFLGVVGFVSGVAVGAFNTGLVPLCGDPCSIRRFGNSVYWGLSFLMAFPVVGWFALKKLGNGLARTAAIAAFLSFVTLLPAAAIYGFELHQFYWQSPARLGVPDFDYSYMAIATKSVAATYDNSRVQIKAWERCALGPLNCSKQPHTVQAVCLGSGKAVQINEADWPAFRRIPEEDLQGLLESPEDMKLCSATKVTR